MNHSCDSSRQFDAPWGRLLRVVSVLFTVLLLSISAAGFFIEQGAFPRMFMIAFPLVMLGGCALFAIRSYSIEPDSLLVHRLLWATRVPLAGLQKVEQEPRAMHRSLRLFGNGGAFSITGWFWNKRLGTYRAFVTDLNRCVVLRFQDRRVVLSPDRPEVFAAALRAESR